MGRRTNGTNLTSAVYHALLSQEGKSITVDEIINLIGLNGKSRDQERRRFVVRTQIYRLRHLGGHTIETVLQGGYPNGGNTAYRLISK